MKRREYINNNTYKYAAEVYQDAGRAIVIKHPAPWYRPGIDEERYEFETREAYEAWIPSQDWIKTRTKVSSWKELKQDPREKYDAANTVQVKLKLNKKTDADILAALESVETKQGYIKALIRKDLNPKE